MDNFERDFASKFTQILHEAESQTKAKMLPINLASFDLVDPKNKITPPTCWINKNNCIVFNASARKIIEESFPDKSVAVLLRNTAQHTLSEMVFIPIRYYHQLPGVDPEYKGIKPHKSGCHLHMPLTKLKDFEKWFPFFRQKRRDYSIIVHTENGKINCLQALLKK